MDQRNNERNQEEIPVWLYKNNSIAAMARTRDISKHGMFIVTNVLLFPKGTRLDVVFEPCEESKRVRMPVKVIHRSLAGIGVELEKISDFNEAHMSNTFRN